MAFQRCSFSADNKGIVEACNFARTVLGEYKVNKKVITKSILSLEESALKLLEAKNHGNQLEVSVYKNLFSYSIEIEIDGEAIEFYEKKSDEDSLKKDRHTEAAIRNILINSLGKQLKYSHQKNTNRVSIVVGKIERTLLFWSVTSLIIAIITGVILKSYGSEELQQLLILNVLQPFLKMFMSGLKMMVTPVVFFSIATSISQFNNISELGKIGGKLLSFFVITTIISSTIGICVFNVVQPGDFGSYKETFCSAEVGTDVGKDNGFSLLKTIVNIVPDNILKPFISNDMLQIIFVAVLIGFSLSLIGESGDGIKKLLGCCSQLFMQTTTLIIGLMPFAIFASITELVIKTDLNSMLQLISWFSCLILSAFIIFVVYMVLILVFTKLNPFIFMKKFSSVIIKSLSIGTSSSMIPDNIACCKKMGISEKICSFSIPLGATINMNGTSMYLVVSALFLAKICGITISLPDYFSLILSSLMLSVGSPSMAGAGVICLSILLMQLNVPSAAVTFVMGIDSIVRLLRTSINLTGDAVCSLIIAKQEKLLDENAYNK